MKKLISFSSFVGFLFLLCNICVAEVPHMINYQGKLTTETGALIVDSTLSMEFKIYDDSIGGNILWHETQSAVRVHNGIFNVLLGSVVSIPDSAFDGNVIFLGVRVGTDPEMNPRKAMLSVGYAMKAGNAREVYHQIIDIMPNSSTKFYVMPKFPNSKVTLYLHGEGFGGAVLAHTHTGGNAHTHSFSGTTGSQSAGHTHTFSGNTGNQSADHTHTGSTSSVNLAHSHGGYSGYFDVGHDHGGSTANDGHHHHDFIFHGRDSGSFLVHSSEPMTLTTDGSNTATAYGSVATTNSDHSHVINYVSLNHRHTIASDLGSHNHTFTTGGVSANHNHSFSGTTSGISANHNHSFSGTTGSSGTGLGTFGVAAGTFPQSVYVYVDGTLRAGPWSGQFSSGAVDLSSYISDTQEHSIEIREQGGNGGRIIYNLYIE